MPRGGGRGPGAAPPGAPAARSGSRLPAEPDGRWRPERPLRVAPLLPRCRLPRRLEGRGGASQGRPRGCPGRGGRRGQRGGGARVGGAAAGRRAEDGVGRCGLPKLSPPPAPPVSGERRVSVARRRWGVAGAVPSPRGTRARFAAISSAAEAGATRSPRLPPAGIAAAAALAPSRLTTSLVSA